MNKTLEINVIIVLDFLVPNELGQAGGHGAAAVGHDEGPGQTKRGKEVACGAHRGRGGLRCSNGSSVGRGLMEEVRAAGVGDRKSVV